MSNPGDADATPITSAQQLADYIAVGCKPRGAVHASARSTRSSASGAPTCRAALRAGDGIRAILDDLRPAAAGEPDPGPRQPDRPEAGRRASISLEPAGSWSCRAAAGRPARDQGGAGRRISTRCARRPRPARPRLRAARLPPDATRAARCRGCPRAATRSCARYMPLVGTHGARHDDPHLHRAGEPRLSSTRRTWCASCASSLALQPLATALFANSPFTEGKAERLPVATAAMSGPTPTTDRTGIPAVVFEDGFGFERYADWLLDVPMYFIYPRRRAISTSPAAVLPSPSWRGGIRLPGVAPPRWATSPTT